MDTHPLTTYRKTNALTQKALGHLLDVSQIAVSRWENGERRTSRMARGNIARVTGISTAEIEKHEQREVPSCN